MRVVTGREEGPFSAPKALQAPLGELGPDPGALLLALDSVEYNINGKKSINFIGQSMITC